MRRVSLSTGQKEDLLIPQYRVQAIHVAAQQAAAWMEGGTSINVFRTSSSRPAMALEDDDAVQFRTELQCIGLYELFECPVAEKEEPTTRRSSDNSDVLEP